MKCQTSQHQGKPQFSFASRSKCCCTEMSCSLSLGCTMASEKPQASQMLCKFEKLELLRL